MKNKNWWKIGVIIAAAILLFGLGFYVGKKREPEVIIKTETKYVELPPIHDSIPKPVPVYVKQPADSLNILLALIEEGKYEEYFPERVRDSLIYVTNEDTAAVIRDWAAERVYKETLFDTDTLGRFVFDAKVQYNRLQNFDYTFTPVQKQTETTIRTVRTFLPYVGAGLDLSGSVMAQGGVFVKQNAGLAIQYRYDTKLKEHTAGALFLYMF
jgi:hypothetical protein